MAKAEWTPVAETDLDEIYLYIAREQGRPADAKQVEADLVAHCDEYAALTDAGHILGTALPALGQQFRHFTHKRWVVLFKPLRDSILVLAVVDGSREYHALFASRAGEQENV